MLVSIFVGSVLASTLSLAANSYFSGALSGLVGEYGEYDLIIQVREEMKDDATTQINKIMNEVFPGAKFKEGPTVTGKTNLFIALPEEFKTKKTFEELGKTFGSIPGGGSVGVMTEPRLTIRGVPEGAKDTLIERIQQMEGVRFVFRDGASIGVVLLSLEKAPAVNTEIKAVLNQYQVIEITFPVGSEPANPIRLGETIANDMKNELKLEYASNVSVDSKNDDMAYMVSTMLELKRFLLAYASRITITPAPGMRLAQGDVVIFQGTADTAPAVGSAVQKNNVVVQVTGTRADGTAEGAVTQGDASQLTNLQAYKLDKEVVTGLAGTAAYTNPRQQLGGALSETTKLVTQIPAFAQDAQNMSAITLSALNNYSSTVTAMEQTLGSLTVAGATIQAATGALANLDTRGIQTQLDSSSRAMGSMINSLQVVRLISPDVNNSIAGLTATQQNLDTLKSGLGALDNVAAQGRQARSVIDNIVTNGQSTLNNLKAFDAAGARTNLTNISGRLTEVQKLDVPLITAQLQYMAAAVPNLKDEDISHSVALLDRFIAGQVIPGARIQVLTTNNISTEAVAPIVQRDAGHNDASLYSTSLGVIEPNTRAEVMQILSQVKAILAGMTAIIATVLFLVLDHTAVMTVIRSKRLAAKLPAKGWRKFWTRFTLTFTAPERRYGMFMGAAMLTAMFVLAGGGIPYLPWIGVPVIGAVLGLIVANNTEKISPVSTEEVVAGEALGLSFDEVMREIVIPSGRPGLMQKLNNRKLKFR
ncbi:MAG: hypothetical protein K0Q75_2319 [Anaerospora sp.]|nr:hypothetical protein [Anaerospora sp.]